MTALQIVGLVVILCGPVALLYFLITWLIEWRRALKALPRVLAELNALRQEIVELKVAKRLASEERMKLQNQISGLVAWAERVRKGGK